MKVKKELIQNYLDKHGIRAANLARDMEMDESEVETLLRGEAVKEATARKFIYFFGADEAVKMIDWAAIGKKNPFEGGKD
ncbi:MAG: hypothetical protein K2K80_08070 [Clostridia bacterium]|nr:hypothetical protein [Clostridia bacterium]